MTAYLHSCSGVSESLWPLRLKPTRLLCPWNFPGKSTRVGCHFLLQGMQGSNLHLLCLLLWEEDCLPMSHLGSPMIYDAEHLFIRLFVTVYIYHLYMSFEVYIQIFRPFKNFLIVIYLLIAVLGPCWSAWVSHCSGFFLLLRMGFSSCGTRAIESWLSSCGEEAWLPSSLWDLPGPEI